MDVRVVLEASHRTQLLDLHGGIVIRRNQQEFVQWSGCFLCEVNAAAAMLY